jgi:hypothetical protein
MAHAQRLDFVFQRKGPIHSNRRGCQLSQAVAGEVCTSWLHGSNAGQAVMFCLFSLAGYPLHSPVSPTLPLPCVTVCHQVSILLYKRQQAIRGRLTMRRHHKPCFHRKCSGNAETVSRSSWYAVGHLPLSICTFQQFEHDGTVLENSCGCAALMHTPQDIEAVRVAMQINPRK